MLGGEIHRVIDIYNEYYLQRYYGWLMIIIITDELILNRKAIW